MVHLALLVVLMSLFMLSLAVEEVVRRHRHEAVARDRPKRTHYAVLGIDDDADGPSIKKAFRALALELHPDKVSTNATQAEKEDAHDLFLDIQDAYFTLSDPERRKKYDLSQDDVTYDIYEDDIGDRYTSAPFRLFAKTKRFRMVFEATFKPYDIPPIVVNLELTLKEVFQGATVARTYYRRDVCPSCQGTGGKDGECRECDLCHGTGTAHHLFSHEPDSNWDEDDVRVDDKIYQQMTETACGSCGGKGCHPVGKCSMCGGKGFTMQNQTVTMEIPPGARQGFQVVAQGYGHRRLRPDSRGDVIAILRYIMPDGWKCDEYGDLEYTKKVTLLEFARGCVFNVELPSDDYLYVTTNPVESMVDVLSGAKLTYPQQGMPTGDERVRGMLTVHVAPDLNKDTYSFDDVVAVLACMGVTPDDDSFPVMMAIFGFKTEGFDGADDGFSQKLDESMFTIDPLEVEILER